MARRIKQIEADDPNNTVYALQLAATLIKQLAGGEMCGDIVDIYPNPVERASVQLSLDYAYNLIGKHIGDDVVKDILGSLEIEIVGESDGVLDLRVPTYRVDVTRPCDVVEDVLRIYGYNNVEFGNTVQSSLSYQQRARRSPQPPRIFRPDQQS